MKEHPILFSAPMVRALLDGSKTMTRRVVKGSDNWPSQAVRASVLTTRGTAMAVDARRATYGPEIRCPYGKVSDQLWVRETFQQWPDGVAYRADYTDKKMADEVHAPWKPSIFMPRAASRITLEIVSVRVERLQRISEADAIAEGASISVGPCTEPEFQSYTLGYINLWESINGPGSWAANPWVWVIEFKRVTP